MTKLIIITRSCFIKKNIATRKGSFPDCFFLFYLLAYINMGVWIFTENVIWEIKRTMHLNHIWSYFLCNTSIQQCHFSRLNRIEKKIIKKLSNSSILFKIHQCFRRQIYFAFFSCMQNLLPIEIETFLICEINSSRGKKLNQSCYWRSASFVWDYYGASDRSLKNTFRSFSLIWLKVPKVWLFF